MALDLEIAVCGSEHSIKTTPLQFPLPHITLSDFDTLENHMVNYSKSHSFILLFLDLNDKDWDPMFEHITKHHIFATFICIKPRSHLAFNGTNVYPVAKQLITRKITLSIIQFFELAYKKLLALNQIGPAFLFKEKANHLKQQRSANGKIKGCHVLIIPLNTTDRNLFDYQERLINLCNDLCRDYEPTVCTLYDYFPSDEGSNFYENEDADIICNFVKKISPIRLYLAGNEMYIPNSLSKYLLETELRGTGANEYDAKYTLVENEPVSQEMKMNLADLLGCRQESTNIVLKRLDEIQHDIEFPAALERVNANLQAREMVADVELYRGAMESAEKYSQCICGFCMIEQARDVPRTQNDGASGEINNKIQNDLIQSFPN